MKALLFSFLALAFTLPLPADNLLQNGDFTDGTFHWRGDGKTPAEMSSSDSSMNADSSTAQSQGMIVPLKGSDWAQVRQDFHTKTTSFILSITFKLSSDLAFSTKFDDYQAVPQKINCNNYKPFNLTPGQWMVFLTDFGANHGTYFPITPKPDANGAPQTFHGKLVGLVPYEDKVLCIAFPPGTGNVTLLHISLTEATAAAQP